MARHFSMLIASVVVCGVLCGVAAAGTPPKTNPNCQQALPFCDMSLSFAARAQDLISRLTTAEKISQLSTMSFTKAGHTPGVSRLGVPAYNYHSEGLHGVRDSADLKIHATMWPQVTAMAATANMSGVAAMAAAMGQTMRALNNEEKRQGKLFNKGCGLSLYGPTINIYRDPRWGRGQESVSEDPYLNGIYGHAFTQAVQGSDPTYLQVATTPKHTFAYSLEDSDGFTRHNFNAIVSQLDASETYLPAFEAAVSAKPQQVMCSYNAINGVPSCLNGAFQNDMLRSEWGFDGSVVSDCDAIKDAFESHHLVPSAAAACSQGILGGCDQDCGDYYTSNCAAALSSGLINTSAIDTALVRTFMMRFKMGEFDDDTAVKYRTVPLSVVNSSVNGELALQAAREAIVLLNNSAGLLPLTIDATTKIAVIGPLADDAGAMAGAKSDYDPATTITVKDGIEAMNVSVSYSQPLDCAVSCSSTKHFGDAVKAAKAADYTIVVVGIDGTIEGEAKDRQNGIGLPGHQEELVQELAQAVGDKLVVVFINGGSVSSTWIRENVATVLDAMEGGQAGGTAVAEVLSGAYNPSGILPFTVYPEGYTSQVKMSDMQMRPNATSGSPGRTYRFYNGTALWPFGASGSYTTFSLKWMKTPAATTTQQLASDGASTSVEVKNTGSVAGAKTVLAFSSTSAVQGAPSPPIKSLYGVRKVFLEPGQSTTVNFNTNEAAWYHPHATTMWDGSKHVFQGVLKLSIGNGAVDDLVTHVYVSGEGVQVRGATQAV